MPLPLPCRPWRSPVGARSSPKERLQQAAVAAPKGGGAAERAADGEERLSALEEARGLLEEHKAEVAHSDDNPDHPVNRLSALLSQAWSKEKEAIKAGAAANVAVG